MNPVVINFSKIKVAKSRFDEAWLVLFPNRELGIYHEYRVTDFEGAVREAFELRDVLFPQPKSSERLAGTWELNPANILLGEKHDQPHSNGIRSRHDERGGFASRISALARGLAIRSAFRLDRKQSEE